MRRSRKIFQVYGLLFLLLLILSSCGLGRLVGELSDTRPSASESRMTSLASGTLRPNITKSTQTAPSLSETTATTTAAQTTTTTVLPLSPVARAFADSERYMSGRNLDDALVYFKEIAANSEFKGAKPITKWTEDVRIQLHGELTDSDRSTLDDLLTSYHQIDGMPPLDLVEDQPNIDVYFVPSKEMPLYIRDYVEGNLGFFEVFWNGAFEIYTATIVISSDRTSALDRNHLIWEELTQSLGLMNDSYEYEDSIFQQDYSVVQQPSALDFALMRLLYNPVVSAGDRGDRAVQALREALE